MYLNIQDEEKTIVVSGDWTKIREFRDSLDLNKLHHEV
jgi:hypothetical protein